MPERVEERRLHNRYPVDVPATARVGDDSFEARVRDVSATGAALVFADANFEIGNDQFVELHMHGLGNRQGYKARDIPGGFALQFDSDDDEERRKLEEAAKAILGEHGLQG